MARMPHLIAYISSHGFGHIAQTAPILNCLRTRIPDLRLTVVSNSPEANLRQRISGDFALVRRTVDFGFVMEDAFRIDLAASAQAYRAFHSDWEGRVAEEAAWLRDQAPDAVLANAACLPLAAAAQLGIPAIGLCSLNWADLFIHVYRDEPWAPLIHAQMLAAYRSARAFIRLEPAMAMPDLSNTVAVGPVAQIGVNRRDELCALLKMPVDTRVVLVALGGVATRIPAERWPVGDVHWLVSQDWQTGRPDMSAFEPLGWPLIDLLASVDALIGKPGYGMFAEAACNGVPMLYARRPDWPEQDALIPWLEANNRCLTIDEAQLATGDLAASLAALWSLPCPPPPRPSGADEAAEIIAAYLT